MELKPHLLGAVHRDLNPENVLWDAHAESPAIVDFGIASFTDDLIATAVKHGRTVHKNTIWARSTG